MKATTLSLTGILAAAIGVVVILFFKSITMAGVVVTGGVLFVIAGVANLIIFGQKSNNESSMGRVLTQIGNAAAIILGVCMLVFKGTFEPLVAYMFGLLLAICALWQFFALAIGVRPYQLHGWTYIFPILILAGAFYIFFNTHAVQQSIMLTTGISLCIMGLGCLIEGSMLGMAKRRATKEAAAPSEPAKEEPKEEKTPEEDPKKA